MRKTKGKVKFLALLLSTITNTVDFKVLLEAIRNADHHVVDKRTGKTMK